MHLTRLRIRNFQCHAKLQIDFDEHVTSIVGTSDSGKSAVMRALRWVFLNEPNGTAFMRTGTDKVFVEVVVNNGGDDATVRRTRSKKLNRYQLEDQNFDALGGKVPEVVSGLFDVDRELNFQFQHDPPFWFTESAGQVARKLNAVVDLDVIDKTIDRVNSKVREFSREVTGALARSDEAAQSLSDLEWAPQMHRDAEGLLGLVCEMETLTHQRLDLRRLLLELQTTRKTLKRCGELRSRAEKLTQDMENVGVLAKRLAELRKSASELSELIAQTGEKQAWLREKKTEVVGLKRRLSEFEVCPECGRPRT